MPTYLVESYATDSAVGDQRVRAAHAAAIGSGITYIRTTIVPATRRFSICSRRPPALLEAVGVAALDWDRIVEVVEAEADARVAR